MGQVTRTRTGLTARRVLMNAEILALPTQAIEILAAPGDNRMIVPEFEVLVFEWAADYSNIDAASLMESKIDGSDAAALLTLHESNNDLTALLAAGESRVMVLPVKLYQGATNTTYVDPDSLASVNNKPFIIDIDNVAAGDLTGGDPANRLIVTLLYSIVTLGS